MDCLQRHGMASTSGSVFPYPSPQAMKTSLSASLSPSWSLSNLRQLSNSMQQGTRKESSRKVLGARAEATKPTTQPVPPTGFPQVPSASESSNSVTESMPCCCSAPEEPAAVVQNSPPSETEYWSKALTVAVLVATPIVIAALNPSLLPFDIDDIQDWLDEAVYFASHEINRAVNTQLSGGDAFAPQILSLVFGAGLITSFAPCTLSVLPLTIGYIAGIGSDDSSDEKRTNVVLNASFFALGLATTFSTLGISAALAGKAYGQMGPGLPIAVSGITMFMGLNLLGLVRFQMPSLFANFDAKEAAASLPVPVQMYLGGMTFALLASPCSTPVLASLLGYVASSEDVLVGFALLLAYTFGRVMPVLVAASFTGSMKQMLSLRQYSRYINPASGALLLGIGTFSLLNRVFPEATAMALGMHGGHM